jgi:hypothetical protein
MFMVLKAYIDIFTQTGIADNRALRFILFRSVFPVAFLFSLA